MLGLPDDDSACEPQRRRDRPRPSAGRQPERDWRLTAVNQLHETGGKRYALATMCIGVGQGIATLILERV
jgi:hypothetical protein